MVLDMSWKVWFRLWWCIFFSCDLAMLHFFYFLLSLGCLAVNAKSNFRDSISLLVCGPRLMRCELRCFAISESLALSFVWTVLRVLSSCLIFLVWAMVTWFFPCLSDCWLLRMCCTDVWGRSETSLTYIFGLSTFRPWI